MVRNIDLPEAIVLYGKDSVVDGNDGGIIYGLDTLFIDAKADGAALFVIWDSSAEEPPRNDLPVDTVFISEERPPPNPHDLLRAIQSVTIIPHAFGGSSGFGKQQFSDPPRPPMPTRTVVLACTENQSRAARAVGTRVIRIVGEDDLCDAVADVSSISVDDIATPGSFWLNPPSPRDDDNNKVDPVALAALGDAERSNEKAVSLDEDELSDEDLAAILADIDPL